MSEFRFRKLRDYMIKGPYQFQGILSKIIIDDALILEGIEVDYYYKVLRVKCFQNIWKIKDKKIWLIGSLFKEEV